MAVVPAGVHFSLVDRGEGKPCFFGYGKGIHIGAEGDRLFGILAAEIANKAGFSVSVGVGNAEGIQLALDDGQRLRQVKADLGNTVQLAPQRHDIVAVWLAHDIAEIHRK